ncbi:hypothetical protein GHV40_11570 [Devosia sp. D6-9]|nr:hypothetical protein GHV40_11570 [Devosia sp. D6-9]
MTSAPFERRAQSIPVTIVAGRDEALPSIPGATVLRVERPLHQHEAGAECVACAARSDVRVLLFDLLERARRGMVLPFSAVIIDARGMDDGEAIAERLLPGKQPAFGLRDHTVLRSFHLA